MIRRITSLFLIFAVTLLAGCPLAPTRPAVAPQTPGEIAASYSVQVRKWEAITAQLLASQSITPEVAQQAHDALRSANQSLRLYWTMSTCKNVRAAIERSAQPGSTELVSAAAQALCAQFGDQPLDDLAQLRLAQGALLALSNQLGSRR